MDNGFRQCMAVRFGIKPAVICEFLMYRIEKESKEGALHIQNGKQWYRCSHRMFTAFLPFLTESMVKRAIKMLIKSGVLVKADLNENKFDHTLWYAFTEYGKYLMKEPDTEKGDGNG